MMTRMMEVEGRGLTKQVDPAVSLHWPESMWALLGPCTKELNQVGRKLGSDRVRSEMVSKLLNFLVTSHVS